MSAVINRHWLSSLACLFQPVPQNPLSESQIKMAARNTPQPSSVACRPDHVAPYRRLVQAAALSGRAVARGQMRNQRFQDAWNAMTPQEQKSARRAYDYFFQNLRAVKDGMADEQVGDVVKTRQRLPDHDAPPVTEIYEVGENTILPPDIASHLRIMPEDQAYGMPFAHIAFRDSAQIAPNDRYTVAMSPGIVQALPQDMQAFGAHWRCTLASNWGEYLGLTLTNDVKKQPCAVSCAVHQICAGHKALAPEFHVRGDLKIVKNLGKDFGDMVDNLPAHEWHWDTLYDRPAAAMRPLLDGLQRLHRGGLVHSDIKPENVFMPGSYFVASDFGLSGAVKTMQDLGGTLSYFDPKFYAEWHHAIRRGGVIPDQEKTTSIWHYESAKMDLNDFKALTKIQDIQNVFIVSLMGYAAGYWLKHQPDTDRGGFVDATKNYFRDRLVHREYDTRDPDKIYPVPCLLYKESKLVGPDRAPFSEAYDAHYMHDARYEATLTGKAVRHYKRKTIRPEMHEKFDLLMEDIMRFHAEHKDFDFTTMLLARAERYCAKTSGS